MTEQEFKAIRRHVIGLFVLAVFFFYYTWR
jgi:hypothetical protein